MPKKFGECWPKERPGFKSPGKNTGVGSHFLLQGIFPDPGVKPGSPALQTYSLVPESPGKPSVKRAVVMIR